MGKAQSKPQLKRLITRAVFVTLFLGTIISCGGGSSNDDGFTYTGNINPANITTTNAARLVANALNKTATSGNNTAARKKGNTYTPSADRIVISNQLKRYLRDTLAQTIATRTAAKHNSPSYVIDRNSLCESGSKSTTGEINSDGLGSVTVIYDNCRFGDETLNGKASLRVTAYDLSYDIITNATYNYSTLTLITSAFSVSFSGSIHSRVTIGTNTERLTYNLVTRDNANGHMTKDQNLVIVDIYDDIAIFPPSFSETLSGRVFDSVHGYVDVTTPVSLIFKRSFLNSGQLLLTGAGNISIRVSVGITTVVGLELDLDGNSTYESVATLTWDTLLSGIGSDLTDSDSDNMHDSWETSYGFDQLNPDDAILDADFDGFSNIEEYLGGSNPGNAISVPQIADLAITKTGQTELLGGSALSYQIVVNNPGPITSSNVVVTDILPTGVSFRSASGSCNHISGTVTCTRYSDLGVGSTEIISITVILPLEAGSISNTATVSSDTPDFDQSNNSSTHITTVLP